MSGYSVSCRWKNLFIEAFLRSHFCEMQYGDDLAGNSNAFHHRDEMDAAVCEARRHNWNIEWQRYFYPPSPVGAERALIKNRSRHRDEAERGSSGLIEG